ncbi:MAG: AI-2E family transporter [Pseudomonadota bacterium]
MSGAVPLRPLGAVAAYSIIAAVAIGLLYYGSALLIPLAVAIFIWHLINGLAGAYHRLAIGDHRLPGWLCHVAALLTILGAFAIMAQLITNNVAQVSEAAPGYEANLQELMTTMYDLVGLKTAPSFAQLAEQISVSSIVTTVAGTLGGFAGNAGIVIVYVVFLMVEQRVFDRKVQALFPDPKRAAQLREMLARISRQIQGYIWVKTLTSLLTGIVSFAIMWTVGVDFAQFWALVIFLLNYIPIIGALLGVIFPSLLALVQFKTIGPFLTVSLALSATQFIVGNIVEPRMMGSKLNLSPLVVILALALWGMLWGVVGMILSIPIAVMVMIICGHFEPTRPIAIMLSSDGEVGPYETEKVS